MKSKGTITYTREKRESLDAGLEFGSSVCASSLCPDFLSGCEIAWDRVYLNEVNYKNEAFFLSVLMVRDPSLESALRR